MDVLPSAQTATEAAERHAKIKQLSARFKQLNHHVLEPVYGRLNARLATTGAQMITPEEEETTMEMSLYESMLEYNQKEYEEEAAYLGEVPPENPGEKNQHCVKQTYDDTTVLSDDEEQCYY